MCVEVAPVVPFTINLLCFLFFNATATPQIYTLSLHDALPIFQSGERLGERREQEPTAGEGVGSCSDRKSTRLNSSHRCISYAVFCLKKKKKKKTAGPDKE